MVFSGCCPSLNNEEKNTSDNFELHLELPVVDSRNRDIATVLIVMSISYKYDKNLSEY